MNAHSRVVIVGAIAGGFGAGLAIAAANAIANGVGVALGVTVAALLAGLATLFALDSSYRRCVQSLSTLIGESEGQPNYMPTGWHEFDHLAQMIGDSIEGTRRLQHEIDEIERQAKSFWSSFRSAEERTVIDPGLRACVTAMLQEFRQAATALVQDAGTLNSAAEKLAVGANDQSETVSRTTSTVEGLSDKIDRISQNAEDAAEACEKSRLEAKRGLEQVHTVIEGMDRLRAQVEINGRKVRRLGDRSVEIGTIVELIKGISSRTDMLALNAAIESVRAGEHGRGFAVVAEEIRKLAERTAGATREIGAIVEAIQADTHESIRALGEEQSEMEQESLRVREAGAALERISDVAEHSAKLVEGISRSTNDQVLATQELVRSMQRITSIAQQTSQTTQSARASLQAMTQYCERFRRLSALDSIVQQHTVQTEASPSHRGASRRSRQLVGSESIR